MVEHKGRVVGSVAIVEADHHTAQLRWLVISKEARGLGLGKKLVEDAIYFSVEAGYSRVFLWTVSELTAAAHVYATSGFVKTESTTHRIWGRALTEEKYELQLT